MGRRGRHEASIKLTTAKRHDLMRDPATPGAQLPFIKIEWFRTYGAYLPAHPETGHRGGKWLFDLF